MVQALGNLLLRHLERPRRQALDRLEHLALEPPLPQQPRSACLHLHPPLGAALQLLPVRAVSSGQSSKSFSLLTKPVLSSYEFPHGHPECKLQPLEAEPCASLPIIGCLAVLCTKVRCMRAQYVWIAWQVALGAWRRRPRQTRLGQQLSRALADLAHLVARSRRPGLAGLVRLLRQHCQRRLRLKLGACGPCASDIH